MLAIAAAVLRSGVTTCDAITALDQSHAIRELSKDETAIPGKSIGI